MKDLPIIYVFNISLQKMDEFPKLFYQKYTLKFSLVLYSPLQNTRTAMQNTQVGKIGGSTQFLPRTNLMSGEPILMFVLGPMLALPSTF